MSFQTSKKTIGPWFLLLFLAAALMPPPADAQRRDDRERGRRRGGPERMIGFLSRLDANQDGRLQSEEIPDRARPMIERVVKDLGFKNAENLSIDEVRKRAERRQRDQQAGEDLGREQRADRGGGREPSASSFETGAVRGFGEPQAQEPSKVAGFGEPLVALEEKYDRRVLAYVDGILKRYDRNQNGRLEKDEWSEVRWSSDPRDSDQNRDGILTRAELSERIARRWGQSSRGTRRQQAERSAAAGESASQDRTAARYRSYAEGLVRRYDENRNGVIDKSEWSKMRGNPSEMDANRDGRLTVEEMTVAFLKKAQGGQQGPSTQTATASTSREEPSRRGRSRPDWGRSDRGRSDRSRSDRGGRDRDASSARERRSYRFLTPAERLEKILPRSQREWFLGKDADGDGQISMAEFTTDWNEEKVREFALIDLDGDGMVTPREYLKSQQESDD